MKKGMVRFWAAWLMALLFAAAPVSLAHAAPTDTRYHVRLDISPLRGLGLFNAEFQLTDGSGTGNNNSRVTVANVVLTNGQLGAVLPPTTGNVSGDLSGVLVLQDGPGAANSLADFAQGFSVAGSAPPAFFDFDLTLFVNALEPSSSAPDNFVFVLLNSDGSQTLPTTGPTGGEVVSAPFDQTAPRAQGFASQPGTPFLAAPTITLIAANAPEPASVVLLLMGVTLAAGVVLSGGRRGKEQRVR